MRKQLKTSCLAGNKLVPNITKKMDCGLGRSELNLPELGLSRLSLLVLVVLGQNANVFIAPSFTSVKDKIQLYF